LDDTCHRTLSHCRHISWERAAPDMLTVEAPCSQLQGIFVPQDRTFILITR
jgi:hypothetical protein